MNNNMLSDSLRKIVLVGIGAMATTTEKCTEIIDELVKKGEVTVEQGKVLNEELKRNLNNAKENFNRDKQNNDINNDSNMKDYIFNNIDKLQKDELAILKAKIMKMQEEKSE